MDDPLGRMAELAEKLSDDDLRRVLEFLSSEYRARLKRAEERAALSFRPGDEVETLHPSRRLPAGARGRVVHRVRTRLHVDFGEQGVWAMLPTGLRSVPLGAPPQQPPAVSSPGKAS
jgi:hypothetical protein